jgi:hypothetical protein
MRFSTTRVALESWLAHADALLSEVNHDRERPGAQRRDTEDRAKRPDAP